MKVLGTKHVNRHSSSHYKFNSGTMNKQGIKGLK